MKEKTPHEALNELISFACVNCKDIKKPCEKCIVQNNKQIIKEVLDDKQSRNRG